RRVVLRQTGDVVEQPRTDLVVEPLRRKRLRRRRQPVAHVVAQRSIHVGLVEVDVDRDRSGHDNAPVSRVDLVVTRSEPPATSVHPGSSSYGSDAMTRALRSGSDKVNSESPQLVATTESPSERQRLRRDSGAMLSTSPITALIASGAHAPAAMRSST